MHAKYVCSFLLVLQLLVLYTNGKLLMSVWVARHGAREPNKPYNGLLAEFNKSFQGHRLLTNIGMRQHYLLGGIFRETYKNQFDITPASVVVRSTVHDRTFMSGMSFLRAFETKDQQQVER